LLPAPLAFLALRLCGERAALGAALLVAAAPATLALLPFFPGERWNLYFGTEPLFLLLAVSAVAAARLALERERWVWWAALGALAASAYLTRLEGAVLGAALAVLVGGALARRRAWRLLGRAALSVVVAAVTAAPYLAYLRSTLGRWALSGRVQAAAVEEVAPAAPAAPAEPLPRGGPSDAVRAFVWGGDEDAMWRALYSLDPSGTRMASQYWGIPRRERPGEDAAPEGAARPGPGQADRDEPRGRETPAGEGVPLPGGLDVWSRAMSAVLPWWLALVALAGLALAPRRGETAAWLAPLLAAGLVPSLLAYVEPRAMLPLVPAACLLAAVALSRLSERVPRLPAAPLALLVALLAWPTVRDLKRAWSQQLPLQRVAAARRAVGRLLRERLPAHAVVVSWHPAIGVFAERPWRVLPYDSFARIMGYARAQRADAVVFTSFEPSPLRNPPRAFTVLLLDGASDIRVDSVTLEPVEETPLFFVGRLAPAAGP
jgi:hypothetical protein